ncbi:uncharacterized protein FOMMEDRAFT_23013 [Fomitiporia mediterranea MF3/22]|uniref:uncharacterized protein n=1 Tax=Fomitiporia mediterranea (strain MF3/22) TaxID=694068 RepID=UPI0004407FB3|nr:uncharacterized protein FOMMEDRAFT_23013 [Fomitiporia mediterranea MF3/22]EJC99559.1 hypothetical protein FOMMEDRAFT_23013 [Fomitiporia mediterranea MF3/22]
MQPTLALSVLALLITQASALTSPSLLARQSAGGLGLGSIPDACQATCSPIETTINSCQDLSCLCNNTVANQIADCANCLVAVGGDQASSLQTQEQSIIDQYTNACATSGEPISSIKVSSVAPTATGSGLGSSSSSIGLGSAPSSTTSASGSSGSTGSNGSMRTNAGAVGAIFAGLLALALA